MMAIRNNYVILASRIVVEHLPAFAAFKQCVSQHVPHKYSDVMSAKSETVSALAIMLATALLLCSLADTCWCDN